MNKNALLFLGLAVAVLVGLFYGLRGMPEAGPQPSASVPTAAVAAATVAVQTTAADLPKPQRFEVVVSKGKLLSGPAVIQVHEGDDVQLQVTSDHADELHMHGYDLHLSLKPNVPATLSFRAEHSGRFDYELHHAHAELGTLEVQPK
jgi:FtsP/CotA-like multicopper oxidase with cupredoxin domain